MFLERSSYISENQINKVVKIHNGKEFVEVLVIKSIVGIKAGCFAPTRKPRKNKKLYPKCILLLNFQILYSQNFRIVFGLVKVCWYQKLLILLYFLWVICL